MGSRPTVQYEEQLRVPKYIYKKLNVGYQCLIYQLIFENQYIFINIFRVVLHFLTKCIYS